MNQFSRPNGSLTVDLHTGAQRTHRRAALGVYFICPARSRCCRTDGWTALLVLMDIETTRAPTQEPGLQSLLARGARQRRSVAFLRCFADRFATVRLAL